MRCPKCNAENENQAQSCSSCGYSFVSRQKDYETPSDGNSGIQINPISPNDNSGVKSGPSVPQAEVVTFGGAIKKLFSNYATFDGRASRSEYWYAYLFCVILALIPCIGWITLLGTAIPMLACGARRLHDTGKPATYLLFGLLGFATIIPFVGWLVALGAAVFMICLHAQPSVAENQWGKPAPGTVQTIV